MTRKEQILAEIRRTAAENGGVALGKLAFAAMTGIADTQWLGKLWARWGDARVEAGFAANEKTVAYSDDELLR